ncbi:MAG: radical SAM protein, partial [Chloroflexi bacterium]|nr:radical SAM protein [Chloroflexota bacterium]
GSGAIFFAWCNLRCVFCQNADISQGGQGMETTPDLLAAMMLDLQTAGCHNINLVSPGHVVPQILEALLLAVEAGLRLPLVYNTSAYDSLYCLGLLDGVVDIYMPDFKFWDPHLALRYLKARNYPRVAKQAIAEMYRQVGDLRCDEAGLAQRGLLLRHLVMPGCLADTERILHFVVEELSSDTYLNLMDQYHPCNRVDMNHYLEIGRELGKDEFMQALKLAHDVGLWRIERNSHWKALRRG